MEEYISEEINVYVRTKSNVPGVGERGGGVGNAYAVL